MHRGWLRHLLRKPRGRLGGAEGQPGRQIAAPTPESDRRDAEIARLEQRVEILSTKLRERCHEQLAQSEKLAAVGELIAGIAHELNNPLAIMQGHMELLTRELGPETWSVRQEIEPILRQIERSRGIIDSLLRIARPMDDIRVLEPSEVESLVQECVALALQEARRGDIEIRIDLQATLAVRISRQDLRQIIINLVVNALHAVESNRGTIEIRSRDLETRGLFIEVRDSGHGIPSDIVDRIFRPFFTTKGAGRGTGLGLSVSTGLIRRYGGALSLESTSARGTEFRVWVRREPIFEDNDNWLARTLVSSLEKRARPWNWCESPGAGPDMHTEPAGPPPAWPSQGQSNSAMPLTPLSCSCGERSPAWPGDRSHAREA
jgi:two-component system NtrC family sensor kinase